MSVITLLTDFGTTDEYAGLMKGVILSVNPDVTIVDITHHIDPQDLIQAVYILHASYRYFPEGSVHVIVVDPGVGSERAIVCVKTKGYILLAPDNGVLTLILENDEIESVIRLDNSAYFSENISQTFHGRDIFAPVAAHITKGVELNKIGSPMDPRELVRLNIRKPYLSDTGELIGSIISVDRFGNLITNIDSATLERFYVSHKRAGPQREGLCIRIREKEITGLSRSYADAAPGYPLAIIGSRGFLEIAVNCGHAKEYFGMYNKRCQGEICSLKIK